jgi:anaerobic selenocysteine-containing dehydrogenase
VNALRGHSNIQGLTDLGLLSTSLPGYLTLPSEKQADLQAYLEANTPKATLPDQVNYWSNYPKFYVSLMKSFYGDAAQKENDWGFEWLPKWDQAYDVIKYFNMMDKGDVTGYICQGFNPVASFPDKNKVVRSLSKLKYMVVIDPLVTETSTFWQNHGNRTMSIRRRFRPKCSACRPPALRKRTALLPTPAAGCSGTGKARTPRAKRVTTARSWPGFTTACAKCTAPKAAKALSRC